MHGVWFFVLDFDGAELNDVVRYVNSMAAEQGGISTNETLLKVSESVGQRRICFRRGGSDENKVQGVTNAYEFILQLCEMNGLSLLPSNRVWLIREPSTARD